MLDYLLKANLIELPELLQISLLNQSSHRKIFCAERQVHEAHLKEF
jgi:hypothetical protein